MNKRSNPFLDPTSTKQ